ncbi:LAFE_0B05314g1_1 [Lachancea fermentati]|uniref:LAFE_0B05314g1_1 n=1 Tax=Lachancea fermentati TaxID=4955 RepID=A0A1G4M7Y4_LACFM|nr:LAFE_0B05314g1_1 [Lachancea fermentati]
MQDLQLFMSIFFVMFVCYWQAHKATMSRFRSEVPALQ